MYRNVAKFKCATQIISTVSVLFSNLFVFVVIQPIGVDGPQCNRRLGACIDNAVPQEKIAQRVMSVYGFEIVQLAQLESELLQVLSNQAIVACQVVLKSVKEVPLGDSGI